MLLFCSQVDDKPLSNVTRSIFLLKKRHLFGITSPINVSVTLVFQHLFLFRGYKMFHSDLRVSFCKNIVKIK